MKQCPNCKTTYTDDSLQFCLADGAKLLSASTAAETVQMSLGGEPLRVNIPPDSAPTVFVTPPISTNSPAKKGFGLIIAGALIILMLLAGAGIAGFILFRQTDQRTVVAGISPTPTVAPTATPNGETERLKEEMANLKKQIREQKKQNPDSPVENFTPDQKTTTTARANSPNDGFLALRSEPNSETGYRVAKIPHGAALTVLGCPKPSNVGKMPGRWCQVVYNGQSGWAFDGFMTF